MKIDIRKKHPARLKSSGLDLFEKAIASLKSSSSFKIALSHHIVDKHIATCSILEKLESLDDIEYSFKHLEEYSSSNRNTEKWLVLSGDGDTYLLTSSHSPIYRLTEHLDDDNEISYYEGTLNELVDDFNLLRYSLVLKPKKNVSTPVTNSTPSYVYQHFINHFNIAKSIVLISVVISLLSVVVPLGFQTFTDKILPYSANSSLIAVATLLLLGAMASSVFQCFRDYQESILLAKYQNGLGKDVFSRLLSMDVPFFDSQKIGDLTKLIDQVSEASNFLVRQLLSSVVSVVSLLVVIPFLILYSPMLSAIVFGIGILMATTVAFSLKFLRKRVMQSYSYDASYQSTLIEIVKGMRTIKSLANESHFKYRINTSLETNLYGDFHIAKLSHIVRAILNFQSQLITISIIFFGAQAVFENQMSIGQLIAFNMMAGNVINPLLSLVMTANGWETFRLAKNRLEELEPPSSICLDPQDDELDLNGKIEFQDVWFKYPSNNTGELDTDKSFVLKGINLTIQPSEIIGIVGGSGSGKSTVANLLLGFYKPTKGKIKINGYDIGLIPSEVLRSRISSVQQTNFIFNTSVLENIHLGRLNSKVEEIQNALKEAGCNDFVDKMPQNFLTSLSEDGANLSGGQKQRLAIARALVRNSDILLFDEATSALDNQTEEKVKETIFQACQNKTGIIIAHRLNTLSYCDRIVVMQHGEIEVVGAHEELLTHENSYKTMWEAMLKRDTFLSPEELKAPASKSISLSSDQEKEAIDAI